MQRARSTANRFVIGLCAALALPACAKDQPAPAAQPAAPAVASASAPSSEPPKATMSAAPSADAALAGTVVETMNSGGYTYAKLEQDGKQIWVAGPETPLAVGARLTNLDGTLMTAFKSPSLNRTFDQIYFVGTFVAPGSSPPAPSATAETANQAATPPIAKVAPAPGGKTIAQIIASKDALAGKPIVVRGQVVKVNNGILGHNWIHLQDGTGDAGANDLTITTSATAQKGDVVVVRGTVATNKDFGAGYRYAVIVEDATIASK